MFDLVFEKEGYCAVKCSLPKDYNDPYELFLGIDLNVPTDCLATYKDIVNEIPQYPTTCFSESPIVSPMWAHYAQEHTGFALEFETEELEKSFQNCLIEKVNYRSEPNEILADYLLKASRIGKPRHAAWLMNVTFSESYFSKYVDWQYEQETRFVDNKGFSEDVDGNTILFIPLSCITSIITGSKFPSDKLSTTINKATEYGINWYKLEIGKSYPVPYMKDHSDGTFIFKSNEISEAGYVCESCSEPLISEDDKCPWCKISDSDKLQAAAANPFRILDHYGRLAEYLEEVSKIGQKKK